MSSWLKAGVIGAVIVVVLKVLQVVPCVNCCAIPAEWVAYGCIGALAAYWISPMRTMGTGAWQGALAALIAAAIGGVIGIGVSVVGNTVLAPMLAPMQESMLRQMPPEFFSQLVPMGITPELITRTGQSTTETITGGAMCCTVGLVIAAVLGAIGGLVFAVVKPKKATT